MKNDLSRLNLNLLVALEALLKERHVTNAGKRLHITQSAMSNLLKQLRDIFHDKLFIRGRASRLIPTPYILELEPRVIEALAKIRLVFQDPEIFNPAQAKETFTIGLSDYTEFLLLPILIQRICQQAPGVDIIIKHVPYIKNKNMFEDEDIDIMIALHADIPETLIAQLLFTEKIVLLGAKKNPIIKKPITYEILAQAKYLVTQFREHRDELISESILKKLGMSRRVVVTLPHALVTPYILATTHLVSITVERLAKQFTREFLLAYQIIPFMQMSLPVHLIWHPKNKNNAAHRWLRETIITIAKEIE